MKVDLIKGVLIGIISPIIAFIVYVVSIKKEPLENFINNENLPAIISLSLLINLALFFLKLKLNKDEQSRGILISTFLYGVVIVFLKFT